MEQVIFHNVEEAEKWNEVIKHELKFLLITEDITQDRSLERYRIKVMDHN